MHAEQRLDRAPDAPDPSDHQRSCGLARWLDRCSGWSHHAAAELIIYRIDGGDAAFRIEHQQFIAVGVAGGAGEVRARVCFDAGD